MILHFFRNAGSLWFYANDVIGLLNEESNRLWFPLYQHDSYDMIILLNVEYNYLRIYMGHKISQHCCTIHDARARTHTHLRSPRSHQG